MPGLAGIRIGHYRLKEQLERGGMSEVYLAEDVRIEREVAVKIVGDRHADYIERFRREAEAIMTLHHAHILPALDYGEHEHWHYLVMPYIAHGTLREQLTRGPLTLEDAGALLEQIASALNYAHEQGIIHRDIKPSNILMRDDHYAYLADFGLAKSLEGGNTITQIGLLLGTPEYMAPELAHSPATICSDLYALGILLYQMVTGQVPFSGETPIAVYLKQLQDFPTPPSLINPAIPPAVEQVILRVLDKTPQRRYQTANELAQAYINALTFPYQVEEEELLPASHYSAASMGTETAKPFVHVPDQHEKFVLSNDHSVAPLAVPAIPTRRRRLVRQAIPYALRRRASRAASLPQYTAEPRTPAVSTRQSAAEVQVSTRRRRLRYRRRNRVLISMTVVLAMLLLVLILALILAILFK
jgi:eukaryotic-like serine/threonine-protein kinase